MIDVDPDAYLLKVSDAYSSQVGRIRPSGLAGDGRAPAGLRTTVEVTEYFFGEGVGEEQAQEVIAFGTQVGEEDLALCESVQLGLDTRMVPQGRLMLESERLIHAFQTKVAAAPASAA